MKKITVSDSGKTSWYGGARCLVFVYSNRGNFCLEGYHKECENYLNDLKRQGYKYLANFTLWHHGRHRSIWEFWKSGIYITEPRLLYTHEKNEKSKMWSRWRITDFDTIDLEFKRLPKRWIPEFENI